ncbi:type II secretion system F family protein (plasmid) [Paenibacillus polymyxa]|uniref:type II secretion system F family protein n=1 Tax=Paenibacillus polymyxa TaxID=1406 RepID=UPI003B5BA2D7
MTTVLPLLLLFIWLATFSYILPKVNIKKNKTYHAQHNRLLKLLGYDKVQKEASHNGIQILLKEFVGITLFSAIGGIVISLVTKNYFFIVIGVILCFMLPQYIIGKVKRSKREEIMFELPDNLKTLTSKLIDFASVLSALEQAVPDMYGQTKPVFQAILDDLTLGFTLDKALEEAQKEIRVQRFTEYCEKLVMAEQEGFHEQSIQSLKETTKEFSLDNTMIRDLQIKSKKDKRQLIIVIILAWFLPVVLSTMNTGNANVFLDTFLGQFYIAIFVLASVFVLVKSDEWLAVNLEEL